MGSSLAPDSIQLLPQTSSTVFDTTVDPALFFSFEEIEPDVFRSIHLRTVRAPVSKAFGGLVFAQCLAAAERTVQEKFRPHATHSFFILNVDARYPVDYRVQRTRDGGSFCTRQVEAWQRGKIIFELQASFHVKETGGIRHQSMMPEVTPPEECLEFEFAFQRLKQEVNEGLHEEFKQRFLNGGGDRWAGDPRNVFEVRPVDPETFFGLQPTNEPFVQKRWLKLKNPVESAQLNRYLVLYQTDAGLLSTATREHARRGLHTSMTASLDHNVWIHEPDLKANEWMLYENRSTFAGDGRGFIEARLWSRDGQLLLSITQEALIRVPKSKL